MTRAEIGSWLFLAATILIVITILADAHAAPACAPRARGSWTEENWPHLVFASCNALAWWLCW